MHVSYKCPFVLFQMVGWTFENALTAIQSPPSIPFTILLSMDGLRLGDIHFAKIQMTLGMQTVTVTVLERWVESGRFNPEGRSLDDYSHSTAILIVLTPNDKGTALTYAKCRTHYSMVQGTSGTD